MCASASGIYLDSAAAKTLGKASSFTAFGRNYQMFYSYHFGAMLNQYANKVLSVTPLLIFRFCRKIY